MSYWVYLTDDDGNTLEMDDRHDIAGGTYVLGGTAECELNVTYNYAPFFYRVLGDEGLRGLQGQRAASTIPRLEAAIAQLGDDVVDDYWQPTEGNAKQALKGLLVFAKAFPEGIWDVS
jgi:hypothetical protein